LSAARADHGESDALQPLKWQEPAPTLRRRGEAVEVGRVAAWLASNSASYMSGISMLLVGAFMEGW
jgi:NAD(P)-dependent dehydrogenase (short-subunit alcohol dehydrogenase family)